MSAGDDLIKAFNDIGAQKMILNTMIAKKAISRTELAGVADRLRAIADGLDAMIGRPRGEGR